MHLKLNLFIDLYGRTYFTVQHHIIDFCEEKTTLILNDGRFMILERLLRLERNETKVFLIGHQLTVSNETVVNNTYIFSSDFISIVHKNDIPILQN